LISERFARTLAAVAVLLILVPGCAKPPPDIVEVEGIVLLDGVPLNDVEVRFIPALELGPQYIARGVTAKDGRFTLSCNGRPGACACENHVTVTEAPIPANLRSEHAQKALAAYLQALGPRPPQKYGNLALTTLVLTVDAGRKDYKLELENSP
jgi:hypothetical protein